MPENSSNPESNRSAGWEAVAPWFIEYSSKSLTGAGLVDSWAQALPTGAKVLDVGCGPGSPRSDPLARAASEHYAIDASPRLTAAYGMRYPSAHVACEPVEESRFFDETFDGILAWGILFLLSPDQQRDLLRRLVVALKPGGRLLFTAPAQKCSWSDQTTGQKSLSLGASAYREILYSQGATLEAEIDDGGGNHYYAARKGSGGEPTSLWLNTIER